MPASPLAVSHLSYVLHFTVEQGKRYLCLASSAANLCRPPNDAFALTLPSVEYHLSHTEPESELHQVGQTYLSVARELLGLSDFIFGILRGEGGKGVVIWPHGKKRLEELLQQDSKGPPSTFVDVSAPPTGGSFHLQTAVPIVCSTLEFLENERTSMLRSAIKYLHMCHDLGPLDGFELRSVDVLKHDPLRFMCDYSHQLSLRATTPTVFIDSAQKFLQVVTKLAGCLEVLSAALVTHHEHLRSRKGTWPLEWTEILDMGGRPSWFQRPLADSPSENVDGRNIGKKPGQEKKSNSARTYRFDRGRLFMYI